VSVRIFRARITDIGHVIDLQGPSRDADVSGNDDPLDFGSSFANVEEFLIPIMALNGIFVHQAINTMQFI
jgi:hypothetical protein